MKNPHFMILLLCLSCDVRAQSSIDTVIVVGCSLLRYAPNSAYESNLNSLLTSLLNSATHSSYNNFTIQAASPPDTITGLYQCRADLPLPDCATCIAHALSQISARCPSTTGAFLYLEVCYLKYDNSTFLGLDDKTVVLNKCGAALGNDVEATTRRDSVLGALLESRGGAYRVGEAGNFEGVAQCVGDLSGSQCQDCVAEAVGQLKAVCGTADFGDMFLGKCYARYSTHGLPQFSIQAEHQFDGSPRDECSNNNVKKILEVGIGVVVGVGVVVTLVVVIQTSMFQRQTAREISSARTIEIEGCIPYEMDIKLKTPQTQLQEQKQMPQTQLQEHEQAPHKHTLKPLIRD